MMNPNPTPPTAWLNTSEVAAIVGVTSGTILEWCREDRFPQPRRFSRRILRWQKSEVHDFIASMPRGVDVS